MSYKTVIITVSCLVAIVYGQLSNDPDKLLNWCLDGKNHKSKPGPEGELFQQCTPWKDRSCCTYNTTKNAHHTNMYNFNYNHCSHIRNMSEDCRRHFLQDLCFYECSPNIGPWTVKINMKIRNERFFNVPLCQSDCNAWFTDCLDDYTCTDNWILHWNWTKDGNQCLPESQCRTFKEVYTTAENFCQKVWDHSWLYTPDDKPCMRLWFTGANPNDYVAKFQVEKLMKASSSPSVVANVLLLQALICIFAIKYCVTMNEIGHLRIRSIRN